MKITDEEIEAAKSARGGWTRDTLAAWGVPWPPPAGWRKRLVSGTPMPEMEATATRPSACPEAGILHQVVMAVINAGQSDILKGIDDLNAYYGCVLPTVADVIGGRPESAVIKGEISFDDKVYSFTCARRSRSGLSGTAEP